jgi:hypothetical protein
MQQYADFITADFLYVSRASCAHHPEYKILIRQPPVQVVTVAGGSSLRHIRDETASRRCFYLTVYYDARKHKIKIKMRIHVLKTTMRSQHHVAIYAYIWYYLSKIVITWRWPLLGKTCSYFFAIKYYHIIHTTIVVFSWLIFTSPLVFLL